MRYAVLGLLLSTAIGFANEQQHPTPHYTAIAVTPSRTLRPVPLFENPSYLELQDFHTAANYPDVGDFGSGIVVPDGGSMSRDDFEYAVQFRNVIGGGCVLAGGPYALQGSGCLTEPNPNDPANPITVYKERERWMTQTKHVESNGVETGFGFRVSF